jgi:hypothetical protein
MAELYVHGALSPLDVAPVADLLDALVTGKLSGASAVSLATRPFASPGGSA